LKDKLEWAKILDLEVFDDTSSFAIKKYRVKIFKSMTMFDGVMDRLLGVIHKAIVCLSTLARYREKRKLIVQQILFSRSSNLIC
jgi:hypothetical protein